MTHPYGSVVELRDGKKSLFDLTNSTWKCYEREKENKIWKPQMAFYTVTFLTVSAF